MNKIISTPKVKQFKFTDFSYEESSGKIILKYTYDEIYYFEEIWQLPSPPTFTDNLQKECFQKCLYYLHIAAGISYYKALLAPQISIETEDLSEDEVLFFESFYKNGLGEFSYQNNITLPQNIFTGSNDKKRFIDYNLPQKPLVPIGGGKDSLVSIELLKKNNHSPTLIYIGDSELIIALQEIAQQPLLKISRKISPELMKLNEIGAYNGHVPITGILAFGLSAVAILYGFSDIVMSNERSASEGNLVYNGTEINHQWSKSYSFEKDIHNFIKKFITPHLNYFSLLRPLSETAICSIFSKEKTYHSTFKSCNKNFKINKKLRINNWCCNCPKCRFVFLGLANFLTLQEMVNIFGTNMLDNLQQTEGFKDLVGLGKHKPFECVGEIDESAALLFQLSKKDEWKNCVNVKAIVPHLNDKSKNYNNLYERLLTSDKNIHIPESYENILNEYNKI